jgi:hypothetical protein
MAGLETVIGTHNFDAENGDEISFSIGEVIIVLEKDEGYQDGWWQVSISKVGRLFRSRAIALINALFVVSTLGSKCTW